MWTANGKDYRAYLVLGPRWRKGWVLYGQDGIARLPEDPLGGRPLRRDDCHQEPGLIEVKASFLKRKKSDERRFFSGPNRSNGLVPDP
jgi:hypothetical protein